MTRILLSSSACDISRNMASLGEEQGTRLTVLGKMLCILVALHQFLMKIPQHFGCSQKLVPLQTDLTSMSKENLIFLQAKCK